MIKILLCCGGGFSSSALVSRLKKEIIDDNMDKDFYIEYSPFILATEKIKGFDIIVCCPHLIIRINHFIEDYHPDIPIYIMPPRMYGLIKFKELALDVVDILEIYKKDKTNPAHFPGEEKAIKISRYRAYRNEYSNKV